MAGPEPPFALFILTEGVDVEYLNDALTRVWKGNEEAAWDLYAATASYEDAPKKLVSEYPSGTQAPLPRDFRSPFIGKDLESCADWLTNAPSDVALNREYFTAMDQFSKTDDTILICRRVKVQDEWVVEYVPEKTDDAGIQILTSWGMNFDEALQRYQRKRHKDGKPDRSKGVPYRKDPLED